jgi:hypothetical protein
MAVAWSTITQDAYTRAIVQEGFLSRAIHDPLFPKLLFRADSKFEYWEANIGDSMIFTGAGLMPKRGRRRQPRVDASPDVNAFEQWQATIGRYTSPIEINHPNTVRAIVDLALQKGAILGAQAGQTLDAQVRNRLYAVGMSGNSYALLAGTSSTSLRVPCVYGFHEARQSGAVRYTAPSNSNPLPITIGASTAASVTGCSPDSTDPEGIYGPGTLTLAVAKTWAQYAKVFAVDGSPIFRAGGNATMQGLADSDKLTLALIRQAVADMRQNSVPTHEDGYYHVHLDADSEQQLQNDSDWKSLYTASHDSAEYRELVIGVALGCVFYRNTQAPTAASVQDLTGTGFDPDDAFPGGTVLLQNASLVNIHRPVITGADVLLEKFSDPDLLYEHDVQGGKLGSFDVSLSGIQVITDRIKFVWRPPLNNTMDLSTMSWLIDCDWAARTDSLTGSAARYKRARVLEHAGT